MAPGGIWVSTLCPASQAFMAAVASCSALGAGDFGERGIEFDFMDLWEFAGFLAAPVQDGNAGPGDAVGDDFEAVAGEELPGAGDNEHAFHVAEVAATMAMAAQEHLRDAHAATGIVKACVAHVNAHQAGLQVGA